MLQLESSSLQAIFHCRFRLISSVCKARLSLCETFKITINHAGDCWHSKFITSKTVTDRDIHLKQVTVQLHMKEIYYLETKKACLKKTPVHSNQQLAAPWKIWP